MNQPRTYLPASEIEKKEIARLIELLAKCSPLQIILLKNVLKEISENLKQLHPLQFLRVILSEQVLIEKVKTIQQKSMIWTEVIKQCSFMLNQEHAFNNVLPHIPDLACFLNKNPDSLSSLFEKGDWKICVEQFIQLFISNED